MERDCTNEYSENYILLGNHVDNIETLISKIKVSHPEKFEGNIDYFTFELRYAVPFDKSFNELKRLQGTAAEVAGRRDEFKGYIVIDMNQWLSHHDEEYLNMSLLFLVDMNDYWKYIFLVDGQNSKAARELVRKILYIFLQNNILCEVKSEPEKLSNKERISSIFETQGVDCSISVKNLFHELLEQGFSENLISALLCEISKTTSEIDIEILCEFIASDQSIIRYLLNQKEYNRLLEIVENRKEVNYVEKETI